MATTKRRSVRNGSTDRIRPSHLVDVVGTECSSKTKSQMELDLDTPFGIVS